jgi:hypothetical protein
VRHALCTDSDVAVVVMAELLPQPLEPEPHAALVCADSGGLLSCSVCVSPVSPQHPVVQPAPLAAFPPTTAAAPFRVALLEARSGVFSDWQQPQPPAKSSRKETRTARTPSRSTNRL